MGAGGQEGGLERGRAGGGPGSRTRLSDKDRLTGADGRVPPGKRGDEGGIPSKWCSAHTHL